MISIIEKDASNIQIASRPSCPTCSSPGTYLYRGLPDRFFNTPGTWSMRICTNNACRTLWLDPAPEEKDLHKLYVDYSTHTEDMPINPRSKKISLLDRVRNAYLFTCYGYGLAPRSFIEKCIGNLAHLHPAWKDAQAANIFYLPFKKRGVLLDVGCGSGSAMLTMKQKGWEVLGTDFDELAATQARKKGLDVRVGSLESLHFAENSFDAILLNHVIEHVPNPRALFRECYRILKPGGVVVMITPNPNSRGHSRYKHNWRGLETPHHLQLFPPRALAKLGKMAGFSDSKPFSSLQGVFYILGQSRELEKTRTVDVHSSSHETGLSHYPIIKHLRWFILGWLHVFSPNRDEVSVVVCTK